MSKDIYDIADDQSYIDFADHITLDRPSIIKVVGNIVETDEYIFEISEKYIDILGMLYSFKEAPEFDISSYSTKVIENSGYKFRTF